MVFPGRSARAETNDDSSGQTNAAHSPSGVGRTLLVVLTVGAIAYLLFRRLRSESERPAIDEVRELTETVTPGSGSPIPIDEVREIADDLAAEEGGVSIGVMDDEPETDDAEGMGGEATDETERANGEFLGEDATRDEIEERGEDDIQEAPAEPGEITVDEEIVDELVDEAEGETEDTASEETTEDADAASDGDVSDDDTAR